MARFIKFIYAKLSQYIDVAYLVKFLFLLLTLYYFNIFYISIVDKQGLIYSSFLDHHLNYISWLRNSILYTSVSITRAMGLHSFVSLPYQIRTMNGTFVEMVYSCLGLGLMSFWMAFVIANKEFVKRKIIWCTAGILCIWLINIGRVTLLLTAYEHHWKVNAVIDHHTQFNIVAYSLIIFMIWLYLKDTKKALQRRASKVSLINL
jgi:exosortase/archaeosortase family protein